PYLEYCKKTKKPVILEFDDLMTDIPEGNAAHRFYKNKKDKIINYIKEPNACTVSPNYLREVNLGINPNIYVLPNSIDLEELKNHQYQSPENFLRHIVFTNPSQLLSRAKTQQTLPQQDTINKLKGKTKVMWWGSPTHKEDMLI